MKMSKDCLYKGTAELEKIKTSNVDCNKNRCIKSAKQYIKILNTSKSNFHKTVLIFTV